MKQARTYFEQSLESSDSLKQPGFEDYLIASYNLAWLLTNEFDQPDEALAVLKKMRTRFPERLLPVEAIDTEARILRQLGNDADAEAVWNRAAQVYGDKLVSDFR